MVAFHHHRQLGKDASQFFQQINVLSGKHSAPRKEAHKEKEAVQRVHANIVKLKILVKYRRSVI